MSKDLRSYMDELLERRPKDVVVVDPKTKEEPKTKDAASRQDNTPPPGFTALFNGKDLTNWQGLVTVKDYGASEAVDVARTPGNYDVSLRYSDG